MLRQQLPLAAEHTARVVQLALAALGQGAAHKGHARGLGSLCVRQSVCVCACTCACLLLLTCMCVCVCVWLGMGGVDDDLSKHLLICIEVQGPLTSESAFTEGLLPPSISSA